MRCHHTLRSIAVAALVAAGCALATVGCSGDATPGPLPQIQKARFERDVVDGAARLTGKVTVQFDRDFTLAQSKVPFVSHFEITIPSGDKGQTKRVLVGSAERGKDNPRIVTLAVDRIIPEGATLAVERKAFDAKLDGTLTADVDSAFDEVLSTLATSAVAPTSGVLFETPKAAELRPEDRDPITIRAILDAHLQKRTTDAAARQKVLARFDSLPSEIIPSPKLRAALAGLTGTFAEPAIDYLLSPANCSNQVVATIAFQDPPNGAKLLANSTRDSKGRRVISFSPRLEGERFELLMPLMAHEAIHCDNVDGRFEEVAATAFDTFLYMQLLAVSPDLASTGTLLAREAAIDAIVMINSGRRIPESIGILRSAGVTRALPGTGSPAPAFVDFVAAAYPTIDYNASPDEPLAQMYVQALARVAGMQPGSAFNLPYLDELMGRAMDPRATLNAIVTFDLAAVG